MWPWGHAAVGYLADTLSRRRVDERPAGAAVLALVAWHDDGHPGLGVLRRGAVRAIERVAAAVGAR